MTVDTPNANNLIQEWIEERVDDRELEQLQHGHADPVVRLFAAAVSDRRSLEPDASERLLARILASGRSERTSALFPAVSWRLAVSALAAGAAIAAMAGALLRTPRPGRPGVLVKEVVFETEHDGKKVSFELRLYRTEASDDPSPKS